MFIGHIHEHILNEAQNSRLKHHFVKFNNSPNFHKYSTTITTFTINSPIDMIITPIHQQHVSKHHQQQLIMNLFKNPTNHNFIIHSLFTKTQHTHIYDFWHMNSLSTTINHSIHMYNHSINI